MSDDEDADETVEDEPLYDFADWEAGDPPGLADWVKENLQMAFLQFGEGYWAMHVWNGTHCEWQVCGWDNSPVAMRFGPQDLQTVLIDEVDGLKMFGEWPSREEEDVRDVLAAIAAWKAAVQAAEDHLNAMLGAAP